MNKSTKITSILFASALSLSGSILADEAKVSAADATIGIDQAISIAAQEVPGTVLGAEIDSEDGTLIWEIEIENSDNQFFEVEVDATTGAILEIEEDD